MGGCGKSVSIPGRFWRLPPMCSNLGSNLGSDVDVVPSRNYGARVLSRTFTRPRSIINSNKSPYSTSSKLQGNASKKFK